MWALVQFDPGLGALTGARGEAQSREAQEARHNDCYPAKPHWSGPTPNHDLPSHDNAQNLYECDNPEDHTGNQRKSFDAHLALRLLINQIYDAGNVPEVVSKARRHRGDIRTVPGRNYTSSAHLALCGLGVL